MKLFYDKKSNDPTYFIQMGIRNGKKTTTKNVKRIGKHSELLSFTSDPLDYARQQVLLYNEEVKSSKVDLNLTIDFDQKVLPTLDTASKTDILNIGYFILQQIYHDLDIPSLLHRIQSNYRVTFNCDQINRFLSFARILDPRSKLGTFEHLHAFYEMPDFNYQHILRFMDILEDHFDEYITHLFTASARVVDRDTSICYFDCSNYYFEIESEDDDFIDEVTGELIKGLRKYGPSKEHRPNPIVQMGLFIDGRGIPISMCINSGSDNEQLCAIPSEQEIARMFKGKPFIYCADAGLGSLKIRQFNDMGGRAFVVTQSIKKLSKQLQQAVFSDCDYRLLSDDSLITVEDMKSFDRFAEENRSLYNDHIYKVIEVDHAVDVGLFEEKQYKNGKSHKVKSKAVLKQRIIVTFSRKMMEYQRTIRNKQIDRAKTIIKYKNAEDIRKGPHDVMRFVKRTSLDENGNKAIDHYEINQDMISKEEQYDGYYAVATNLHDDVKEILKISSQRYKIEDCFRILKTNLCSRPVNHHKRNRIIAHFMICYTALLIYRLLENKLEDYGTHFTIDEIIETLKNMNVVNVQDMFFMATYRGSEVCSALNGLYWLGLDKKYYRPKDLNKKIKKISF